MSPLRRNLPLLYAFRFLRDFILVMPAIVPLYRECGLDATGILLIQTVFSASQLAFEVPSGYLADVLGRRFALVIGAAVIPVSYLVYALSDSLWQFCLAEVGMALGYAMASGTESAMIFDTLLATGRESEYRRQEGRAEAMTRLGAAVAAVAGGILAGFFLRLPFYVNVLSGLANLVIVASLVEPPRTRLTGHAPLREILAISRESLRDRDLRPPMILMAALMSTGIVAIWGYFLRLTDSGVRLASYGIFFAIFQGSSAVAAVTADRIILRIGRRAAFGLVALVPAVFAVLAVFPSPWALVLAPLGSFGWGLSTPLLLEVINRHVASDRRATVLSVGGMVARVAFIVVAPVFGWLSDAVSDRAAFAMLAGVTIAAGVATLPGLVRERPDARAAS